jgi:hypothetical protein
MRARLTLIVSGILVILLATGAFGAELAAQRSSTGGDRGGHPAESGGQREKLGFQSGARCHSER